MDILVHPAARWGPNDFDLPIQHLMQTPMETSPQYLQPTHEPQIRLPSFSSWFSGPQNEQSVSLPTLNSYNGPGREQSLGSPPSLLPPLFPMSKSATNLRLDADVNAAHMSLHDHKYIIPPVQIAFRNPWEDSNYTGDWTNDKIDFQADITDFDACFEDQQPPITLVQDRQEAALLHAHHADLYTMPDWSQQKTPYAVISPRHIPSPGKNLHTTKQEEQPVLHAPSTPNSQSPSGESSTEALVETADLAISSAVDRSQSLDCPFVHNLCGKAFATLAGVRKHHWGRKPRDLNTTTGCWAKHCKPNVAWDDHPSCKDGRSTTTEAKTLPPTTKQKQTKSSLPHSTMPLVDEGSRFQSLPGFPTLEHLPQTVAKAVNAGIATDPSTQEPEVIYQKPLLASQRSFDTLLTAVNVVSRIDAPKPKGRADSIAQNLDAQIAAAEQHHPFMPADTFTGSFNLPRYPAVTPAALSTVASPSMGGFSDNISGHRMGSVNEGGTMVFPSDVNSSLVVGAMSRPFQPLMASSSGPARKKRKV